MVPQLNTPMELKNGTSETGNGGLNMLPFYLTVSIASKISDPDIPDREPDEIDGKIKIWYLGENYRLMINEDGDKVYTKDGQFHREDGPAIIYAGGAGAWFLNGNLHREDGPAIEHVNGTKEWFLNGQRHREDGPAIEYSDGSKYWYLNGNLHREDGPAIEHDGSKTWYLYGKRHWEDGPAVELNNGTKEWCLNNKQIKSKDYNSPQFQKRWKKLVELERVRQVMED